MNSRSWSKVLFAIVMAVLVLPMAFAQGIGKNGPNYDAKNEVKVKGVVDEVRDVPGDFEGTHLVVKSDSKTVLVHVAPSAFLKELESSYNKGDEVEVVGSKTNYSGQEEILAREITVGNNTTTLRDPQGVPIWAGWKPQKSTGK